MEGRDWAGCAVPVTSRVVCGTVGAARGRGHAAVEDWFDIPSFWATQVGVAVVCLSVRAGTKEAKSMVPATGFYIAESPTVITLCGGEPRIGSLNEVIATKNSDSGEVG